MRKNKTHGRVPLLLLALPLMAADECATDLLGDGTFDLWCGEELCEWEVEEGDVRPVSTWHEADKGAELLGETVVLGQTAEFSQWDADCILFTLQADHADSASLRLTLDFQDDGTDEYDANLVSDAYKPVSYTITPPLNYDRVRFRVHKAGSGQAVLAAVRAQAVSNTECVDPPLSLVPVSGEGDTGDISAD